jgi:hypothetical protein
MEAQNVKKGGSMLMKLVILVLVVVVIYGVYSIFFKKSGSGLVLVKEVKKATEKIEIKSGDIQLGSTSNYTYSMWLNFSNFNYKYGQKKHILKRGNGLQVYLAENNNDIVLSFNEKGKGNRMDCTIKDVPLQKWINIIFSINTKSVDIYIDGKLRKVCVLKNTPIAPTKDDDIVLCDNGGFSGKIALMQYIPAKIGSNEAYKMYKSNTSGLSSKFNLVKSNYTLEGRLIKNNEEVGSVDFSV